MRRPWNGTDFALVCLGLITLINIIEIVAGWVG